MGEKNPNVEKAWREVLLMSHVVVVDDCWLWTAKVNSQGYGSVTWRGKTIRAHRAMYELARGPIPAGLTLDHLCRTPGCIKPDHLEAVDIRTNILRGNGPCAINARKTNCPSGHPLSGSNLSPVRGKTIRRCRECLNAKKRAARAAERIV